MEEKEYSNIYAIPANLHRFRQAAGRNGGDPMRSGSNLFMGLVGYPELFWIPMPTTIRIVCMTVTLLPLGVVALMGADGGSLLQYLWNIVCFFTHRRKLHCRRVGYQYAQQTGKKRKKAKGKKSKSMILSRTISESGI